MLTKNNTKNRREFEKMVFDKLSITCTKNGISDKRWEQLATRIAKMYDTTIEDVYEVYDRQTEELISQM